LVRDREELHRLVRGLAAEAPADVAAYRLSRPATRVAADLAARHNHLVLQLREQQAACQRLDVGVRAAQAAQHRAEAILHGLHDVVLMTNPFGELLQANREATRALGIDFETARGRALSEALRDAALAQTLAQLMERVPQAGPQTEEVSVAVRGKPRVFKAHVARVTDPTGAAWGIVLVLHDVTAEKAAQSRTAEFVSAVGHEIKTPLTSVKAYVELLADGDLDGDPAAQRKYLGVIESEANRMSRMLDGLLDLARIESGVVRIEKRHLALNEVLERTVQLMSAAARDRGLTLESRLSPLYLNVNGDADLLNRVVTNLVSNAIKYTPAGGRITVRSHMSDEHAVVEVQDTGHGIPLEAMGKLFQKFYRVEQNARVAPGTGLGLALVKHLVEQIHGGTIEVESQVGRGSTFRVLLPLAGAPAEPPNR
jgi:two-component system phosphate regulon sensor histidine kinase PhoR